MDFVEIPTSFKSGYHDVIGRDACIFLDLFVALLILAPQKLQIWKTRIPGTGSNNVVDTSWGSENEFPRFFGVDHRRLIHLNPLTALL